MQNRRRVLLISYEDLLKTKLKKLSKISEKIYIFFPGSLKNVSINLVNKTQKLGNKIKWVKIPKDYEGLNSFYNFFIGSLNEKLHISIEICVFSNSNDIDPLINNLNEIGRSALRVKSKKTKQEKIIGTKKPENKLEIKEVTSKGVVKQTADLTVEQLEASGNRPAEAASLKNYILLNSKDEGKIFDILDEVIYFMEANNQIKINEGIVSYNF